ncbi:MAG TPA: hypothetical protein VFN67_05705 [Polyangiales bacterium]|nr:hypothetical protein [Polyangiales bacterium]
MMTNARFDAVKRVLLLCLCCALTLGVETLTYAQEDDDLGEGDDNATAASTDDEETAASPASKPVPAAEAAAAKPPAVVAPPAPSPFQFVVKGLVSGSMFMQNVPTAPSGGSLAFSTNKGVVDGWFLGGDVRQTRLTFTIRGPEVLGGATPTGVAEMDLGGYNYQFLAVGGLSAVIGAAGPMGTTVTVPVGFNVATNESRFDENLVPRMRLAYVELNWNNSQNVLRVGQYHNLLLGMIAGSASHIALPLGYGAGQLGWRSPGITYLHRFPLSMTSGLDVGFQINRNSWRDELPNCGPGQVAPQAQCLPFGVSAGEASMLPQVEARIMAFGGMVEAPLPFYLPVKWLAYLAAHWDRKDLTGVGNATLPSTTGVPYRDTMDTAAVQAGFKTQLGPVLIAANGWYGKNAGNVFGHIFQMQNLNGSDVTGFGAWGQLAVGLTKNLSLWGFGGIDQPDENQVRRAGSTFALGSTTLMRNVQIMGQLAYTDGPIQIAAEFMYVITTALVAPNPMMPTVRSPEAHNAMQPSLTLNYNF